MPGNARRLHGESQCYTRFWTGPSFVHRHRSRLAPDYARESHFQICWRHVPCGTGVKLKFSTGWSTPRRRWASRNNLRIKSAKSKELIFIQEKCGQSQPPPPCPHIERVSCAKVLGITLNDRLSATDHVNCKQLADVVQQFAICDESPPWSRHLDWVAPRRVSRHHPRQDHVLSPCMVWSLLSITPCKTGLISKPPQAPWFLWQYYTHHIRYC